MRKILFIIIMMLTLIGCTEAERVSTINTVHYGDDYLTILFKDGMVIETTYYDDGLQSGDRVRVRHLKDGTIQITKE